MSEKLLSAEEVAEKLDCSTRTVRQLVADGRLPAVRFAPRGWLRFIAEDVDRFVERSRETVPA
jgi:excisionase family DNA binding protein